MTTHRKLIQIATVAALIAALPAQAQILGGSLGGNLGGTLNGSLGSLNGAGALNGAAQGAFDTSGAIGGLRDVGERAGSHVRGVAGSATDKAKKGVGQVGATAEGSVAASQKLATTAGQQAADTGSDPAPAAASPGLLDGVDGGATADGALTGGVQQDVMGKTFEADGSTSHDASADRSGLAASSAQQANVKAGRQEVASPAPAEAAPTRK